MWTIKNELILSRVGWLIRRVSEWIYCTLYIHTTPDKRQYGATVLPHTFQFTVTHALRFSVFISRILATDLSQPHCHFNSYMKSSWNSLVPFLPLFCSCQFRRLDPIHFRLLFCTPCYSASTAPVQPNTSYNNFARTPRKTPSSLVKNACLLVRYLAMDVLLHAYA
jgi:hypothetical protein